MQCGSGPSCDFLPKILFVNTPLSSLCYFTNLVKVDLLIFSIIVQLAVFVYGAGSWGPILGEFFLINISIMTLDAAKFNLYFNSFHSICFPSSLIHIREKEVCSLFLSVNGSKISRRNKMRQRHNILAVRTMQHLKKQLKLQNCFKNRSL